MWEQFWLKFSEISIVYVYCVCFAIVSYSPSEVNFSDQIAMSFFQCEAKLTVSIYFVTLGYFYCFFLRLFLINCGFISNVNTKIFYIKSCMTFYFWGFLCLSSAVQCFWCFMAFPIFISKYWIGLYYILLIEFVKYHFAPIFI